MPEVSIIIPVYNAQRALDKCLESIFNQTFKDYEVIAVNDGSTDESGKILEKYNDKIEIINQQNQGAPMARNTGAKAAISPYIIFCDADIIMKPDMLKELHTALKNNPQASYAYCGFKFGFKNFKLFPFDSNRLKKMPYIHTTSLINKNHFPGFDPKLKRFQDWDLWLTMLKQGHIGQYVPKILFRMIPGGTMSSWLPSFAYRLPWLKKVKQYQEAEKIIKEKHFNKH
jgi:glycosyltransferase involved in cell wall biosynthesis